MTFRPFGTADRGTRPFFCERACKSFFGGFGVIRVLEIELRIVCNIEEGVGIIFVWDSAASTWDNSGRLFWRWWLNFALRWQVLLFVIVVLVTDSKWWSFRGILLRIDDPSGLEWL
ncbi:hypothetical protein B0H15DRAFT_796108 [Mycena belliarum]|uniref:Transmembrane protein n=1 Tax=Mycena belliarum TaxID=1033014 RepID=A0AAD6XWK8_9AGAR|nr:hypothetical protein B0H15DRAFT_796108 [Mycena belliae]